MRLIALLCSLILCAALLFTGCPEQAKQPITDIIAPPPQSSLQKATAAMARVNQRRAAAYQKAEDVGDFSTVFTASETILREEIDFQKGFWIELVEIYREANSENPEVLAGFNALQTVFAQKLEAGTLGMFYFEYIKVFDPLIVEYLRLSYEFPDQNADALLIQYRESVRDGKVLVVFPESEFIDEISVPIHRAPFQR